MDEIDLLIKKQSEKLPVSLQKALSSFNWKGELENISKAMLLSPDQKIDLETETLLLLYNFEPQENFYENLLNNVHLDTESANKIFDLIGEKIISPLTEGVKKQENYTVITTPEDKDGLLQENKKTETSLEERKEKIVSTPDYSSYESGKDPYREPIE